MELNCALSVSLTTQFTDCQLQDTHSFSFQFSVFSSLLHSSIKSLEHVVFIYLIMLYRLCIDYVSTMY